MNAAVRLAVTPLALAMTSAAVIVWGTSGAVDAAEAAVLSGRNLAGRAGEHVRLSVLSTVLAVALAVPAAVAATRPATRRRVERPALLLANLGQAVPTVAVLALMRTFTGLGFRTAVLALVAYSVLPVLRNTLAGLRGVDAAVVDAARGMGMRPVQVLRRVELPLARPVIVAGIRTAAVVNVATAALATFIGAGGLGEVIVTGIANQRDRILLVGAALTAVLALAADWAVAALAALAAWRRPRRLRTGDGAEA